MTFQFLSDEWMTAAREIREEYADVAAKVNVAIKMNQVITDVPFGDGTVRIFIDTTSGAVVMEHGELEGADLTVTTDWETARKVLVDQDQAASMQAFMAGKIKVQGDMMKMMAMQTGMPVDEVAKEIASKIKAITA